MDDTELHKTPRQIAQAAKDAGMSSGELGWLNLEELAPYKDADAAFIAAHGPDAVLKLYDRIESLEHETDALVGAHATACRHSEEEVERLRRLLAASEARERKRSRYVRV